MTRRSRARRRRCRSLVEPGELAGAVVAVVLVLLIFAAALAEQDRQASAILDPPRASRAR